MTVLPFSEPAWFSYLFVILIHLIVFYLLIRSLMKIRLWKEVIKIVNSENKTVDALDFLFILNKRRKILKFLRLYDKFNHIQKVLKEATKWRLENLSS
jgi:hypothetical protein